MMEEGSVWRLQLDTYQREVERYGGPDGILLAERLFQADGEAVLTVLDAHPDDARSDMRWRLAVAGIDSLLRDFGFNLATKATVMARVRWAFAREFHVDPNLKHQLGDKYRKARQSLATLLGTDLSAEDSLVSSRAAFNQRSVRLKPLMAELQALEKSGRLSAPLTELAPAIIHVHVNRLLRSARRAQEVVL